MATRKCADCPTIMKLHDDRRKNKKRCPLCQGEFARKSQIDRRRKQRGTVMILGPGGNTMERKCVDCSAKFTSFRKASRLIRCEPCRRALQDERYKPYNAPRDKLTFVSKAALQHCTIEQMQRYFVNDRIL